MRTNLEQPAEQLIAQAIFARANVQSPKVQPLTESEGLTYLQMIRAKDEDVISASDKQKYPALLRIDHFPGATLGAYIKSYLTKQSDEFLRILCNAAFQRSLGRMIAADVICGNHDRVLTSKLKTKINEGNIMIDPRTHEVVAIDNEFSTTSARFPSRDFPFAQDTGMIRRNGALALSQKTAEREAALLLTYLLDRLKSEGGTPVIDEGQKAAFCTNVAQASMQQLQDFVSKEGTQSKTIWKQMINANHGTEKVYKEFTLFKRMLRQMKNELPLDMGHEQAPDTCKGWISQNGWATGQSLSGKAAGTALEEWKAPAKPVKSQQERSSKEEDL